MTPTPPHHPWTHITGDICARSPVGCKEGVGSGVETTRFHGRRTKGRMNARKEAVPLLSREALYTGTFVLQNTTVHLSLICRVLFCVEVVSLSINASPEVLRV